MRLASVLCRSKVEYIMRKLSLFLFMIRSYRVGSLRINYSETIWSHGVKLLKQAGYCVTSAQLWQKFQSSFFNCEIKRIFFNLYRQYYFVILANHLNDQFGGPEKYYWYPARRQAWLYSLSSDIQTVLREIFNGPWKTSAVESR